MITTATPSPLSQVPDEIQILNRWILKRIGSYIKGRVLEVDSGTNSLCPLFTKYDRPLHLSDNNPFHLQVLRETYKDNRLVRAIHDFDFKSSAFRESHPDTLDVFDTVIALKASLPEFEKMVDNIKYILPQEGTLVLILPAYTSIYHGLGQNIDDWKKYNRKDIARILTPAFSILKVRYLNLGPEIAKGFFANSGLSVLVIAQKN